MKNISKVAEDILKIARTLNLQIIVKLVNGEQGYLEVPKTSWDSLRDDASMEVFFPAKQRRHGGTNFISKKFQKKFLTYVGEYGKETKQELKDEFEFFKHPEFKKKFINDVLEFIGDGTEYVHDIMRYLISRRWRFRSGRLPDEIFTDAGFEVSNGKVSKGSNDVQLGLREKLKSHLAPVGSQRDFPTGVKQTLEKQKFQHDLDTKGCTQVMYGTEFVEKSYAIAKDKNDLEQLLKKREHKGMQTYEMMMGERIYQDPTSQLFWVDTGTFD